MEYRPINWKFILPSTQPFHSWTANFLSEFDRSPILEIVAALSRRALAGVPWRRSDNRLADRKLMLLKSDFFPMSPRLWYLIVLVIVNFQCAISPAQALDVWIGTGRSSLSRGIYHCQFDPATGKITEPQLVAEMNGPGFLERHPTLPVLYAVGELQGEQVVAAFSIQREKSPAALKLLNSVPIGDGGAAHVSLDKSGRTLLTAQYGGGSVAAFSVSSDGSLLKRTELIDHQGPSKVIADRQDAPHAHWTGVSPDNQFAFVPDLGLDQVVIYKLDAKNSRLTPHGHGQLPPGSGPRHMKFHPNGRWIYVVNELSLTVTKFDYDTPTGTMKPIQTIETVPAAELAHEKGQEHRRDSHSSQWQVRDCIQSRTRHAHGLRDR